MNIEYAQTIPLGDIFIKAGLHSINSAEGQLTFSFLRSDSAELLILLNSAANSWQLEGDERTGGPVEFVRFWLGCSGKPCSERDALHWMKFNVGYPKLTSFVNLPEGECDDEGNYTIRFKTLLLERGLIRYVERNGIPAALARTYFRQVYVANKRSGKEFIALGMRNEDGGYAIYSPYVTSHLAPHAITFIRGEPGTQTVRLYLSAFDFLNDLLKYEGYRFSDDIIILHSYRSLDNAAAYIRGYGYKKLLTFFDESTTGHQANEGCAFLCSTERELHHELRRRASL